MTTAETPFWHRLWHTRWRDLLRGQIDGRLDWRQAISAADLPADVRSMIEQVVGCTRLWRREKVDVARELVAHFQDGLEAGRSSQQLVESFGDPRQAAQLIHRAKRRGRSLGWQIWHWACIAFGVLLAVYAIFGVYYVTGRPSIKVDYVALFNERALSTPEELRAWPLYRQALSQILVDREFPRWMTEADTSPSSASWPEAVVWLKEHQPAIALLREATQKPELGFAAGVSPKSFSPADQKLFFAPTDSRLDPRAPKRDRLEDQMLISLHLPHATKLLSSAQLLRYDAQRAAEAGDGDAALADVRAILAIANHIQELPCLVVTAAAARVQQIAFATVEDVVRLRSELWSADQLRDLAHTIAAAKIDWSLGFEGERAMFADTMQRFYTDDGHGDGHLVFRGPEGFNVFNALAHFTETLGANSSNDWYSYDGLAAMLMPAANMYVASRKEMMDLYEAISDDALSKLEMPLWKRVGNQSTEAFSQRNRNQLQRMRHLFVDLLLPAYDALAYKLAEVEGRRDGALIGIALEFYHRQHKSWPKSLGELSPQWLPTIPVDRITGKPLGYKIVDDRPLVYSVGADDDDDGGLLPRDSDGQVNAELSLPRMKSTATNGDWVIWSTVVNK